MVFANPPLWIWAIVVGVLVAGKFAYRWRVTKVIARESVEKAKRERKVG